tara:strand:+ start:146 stop:622 length:477 start_codon:yes stop_codon:yes gene_type:complete
MKIRLYKAKDAADVEELLVEFIKYKDKEYSKNSTKYMKNIKGKEKAYAKSYIKKFNETKKSRFLVLEEEGKIVAYILGSLQINLYEKDKVRGYIDSFFVSKNYRGKGFGKKIYSKLVSWFKKKNCKQIILDVAKGNPSTKIYEKWGFETTKQEMRKKI